MTEGDTVLTVELVRRGAVRHARRTAVVSGDQSLTFAEVDAAANRMAHVLAGLGAARGARVGLLVGNGIWSISADFGCLKAGATRVPLNTRLAADEQARILAAMGVRLLVHGADLADRAGEVAARVDGLRLASLGRAPEVNALDLLEEMGRRRIPTRARRPVPATRFLYCTHRAPRGGMPGRQTSPRRRSPPMDGSAPATWPAWTTAAI